MAMESAFTWIDGKLIPSGDATIHFLTPALHYGMSVFEGIRCYDTDEGPAVFRLHEHMVRLFGSAAVMGWRDLPFSREQLTDACLETIRANEFRECYIRPLIGLVGGGWNMDLDAGQPYTGIAVWEWKAYLGAEAAEKGVRANVSSFTRHHPNVMMTKAKVAGNYPNSILAKTESMRNGFDEAIMLDPNGQVAEATAQNIFIVSGNRVLTPPGVAVLQGITRDTIMVLAREMGYDVAEQPIARDHLYMADEVFVTGTAAEVVGIREIDYRKIGAGEVGPATRALQQAYHGAVRGKHPLSRQWLTYAYTQVTAGAR
jgi:branched-chain amino acid aminotransferase